MKKQKLSFETALPSRRQATRTRTIDIRLTLEELSQIRSQAEYHGMDVSSYLRTLALDESFRRAHAHYVGLLQARLDGFQGIFKGPERRK